MRKAICLILLFALDFAPANAQQKSGAIKLPDSGISPSAILLPSTQKAFPNQHADPYYHYFTTVGKRTKPLSVMRVSQLSPDFYYTHCYGFFCKVEWMTQEKLHIPLSFRLGTYNYERRLEGK